MALTYVRQSTIEGIMTDRGGLYRRDFLAKMDRAAKAKVGGCPALRLAACVSADQGPTTTKRRPRAAAMALRLR